jgi:hypothetical protein
MIGYLKVPSRQPGNPSSIAMAAASFWRDLFKFDPDRAPWRAICLSFLGHPAD